MPQEPKNQKIKIGDYKAFHESFQWKKTISKITEPNGDIVFHMKDVEVPKTWEQLPIDILAQKYLRKAGVPLPENRSQLEEPKGNVPNWLNITINLDVGDELETTNETSAKQVFHRLAGCWTYWGYKYPELKYFTSELEAWDFYCTIYTNLYNQDAAPNSPQWFNTGLNWAYGIQSISDGSEYFIAHPVTGKVTKSKENYERPQVHACYLTPIEDNLVGKGGILDHVTREARIFKNGSGSGSNYSKIRGANESLSGGGTSSGLMSFLKIPDTSAAAIKSGGTTRRAARMTLLDIDHPEILEFINWKSEEEYKVASLVTGSMVLSKLFKQLYEADTPDSEKDVIRQCKDLEVPETYVNKVLMSKAQGFELDITTMSTDYRSEAYQTVSGQNSNSSVLVTNNFIKTVIQDDNNQKNWDLIARTTGEPTETVNAKELFHEVAKCAWISGDPGMLFETTINEWHTCILDGRIRSTNPCSEYLFLDNTSCNLASVNVIKYWRYENKTWLFDHIRYTNDCRNWTKVLEISVLLSQAPSEEVARETFRYRTTGLGYTNIGALIMSLGYSYDSPEALSIISLMTSLMSASAYVESATIAKNIEPFPAFKHNSDSMLEVIHNHVAAAGIGNFNSRISILPPTIDWEWLKSMYPDAVASNITFWHLAISMGEKYGYRNANTSLIAPTGTISLIMDCDTTGIEPDFSLVKGKKLAGGGYITIINNSTDKALTTLGYNKSQIKTIENYILENNTIEGCDILLTKHLAIFDCANSSGKGNRYLRAESHLHAMAAAQPFLSGAISKTVNMPVSASVEDIKHILLLSHSLMLKAVAVYRDQSKLSQPLMSAENKGLYDLVGKRNKVTSDITPRKRKRLPTKRVGYTQKMKTGGKKLYLRTGEYEDGTLGEIFVDLDKEGTLEKSLTSALSISVSLGLQHGVPLEEFVDAFLETKFEPNGPVQNHPDIRFTSSILDLIAKDLAINYLGQTGYIQRNIVTDTLDQQDAKEVEVPVTAEYKQLAEACPECGSNDLRKTGTCKACNSCGASIGGCA